MAAHETYARIWAVVRKIPAGRVATYGQIAAEAGFPKQPRLGGYAMAKLPAELAVLGETSPDPGKPGPAIRGRARGVAARPARESATPCPWHRVINAQGRISFPKGSARYREQKRRLEAEGVVFLRGRVDLARVRWRARGEAPILD
jgi:methylated-DNA-protein-cysteine methyltransferase-like protein